MNGVQMRAILVLLGIMVLAPLASADERVDRLPEEHKAWLEREVVYIITKREREVFLTVESVEERNRFIEAFWRKRDPNPATLDNEYKIEHYRRIDYANTYLGRETFREGWRTDRGRYYILLGEPREIQRFDGYGQVVSSHLWFYQGDLRMGTPAFFYLLFFKKNDFGEYQLYSPVIDGPQALLTGGSSVAGSDNAAALQALSEVSPELETASLSFDTSEPADFISGRPALGTDIMIARIQESPKRAIRADYAEAWLRYGNRVSAEYSFNFVPSRHVFSVLTDPSGTALVHYSVEIDPQNFSMETDEERTRFYTTLDLTTEARTTDGTLVFASDKEAFIELTPSQVEQIQNHPFGYRDDFPLVPGDYTVTVIVKNRVLSQYTVAEAELHIPRFTEVEPVLTDIILAFDTRLVGGVPDDAVVHTYQVGRLQVEPAAENIFVIDDTVHLVTQAFGASPEHKVVFELRNGEEVLRDVESVVGDNGMVLDHLKLEDMVGGDFEIRARLLSPSGETLSEKTAAITVSPRSTASRPRVVYRRGVNTRVPGLLSAMRGEQFWRLGKFEEAKAALEESVSANPKMVAARFHLADIHLLEGAPDMALALLKPLEEPLPNQYDVVAGLGRAVHLKGDYARAVGYLERARELKPPDTAVLNALGDSHQRLGNFDEAREAFQRSLELDADQPIVRERLAEIDAEVGKN